MVRSRLRPATVVAVLTLLVGAAPLVAQEYTAGRYRIADVQVSEDADGQFSVRARVTNTGETEDPTPVIGVLFLRDGQPIGEAEGYVFEGYEGTENEAPETFEAGVTHVVTFVGSSSYSADFDGVRFEIYAGEDE